MTQPNTGGQGGGVQPGGTPDVPSAEGRYSAATLEQILVVTTGRGKQANLHGLLGSGRNPGHGWLVQGDIAKDVRGDAQSFDIAYGAWDKTFIGVNRNRQLFDEFARIIGELMQFIGPLEQGRLDDLDVFRLVESAHAVEKYVGWLALNHMLINSWVQGLSSDDSEFKGKAANAIRQNLVVIAEMMAGLHWQIMVERTPDTPTALKIAAVALRHFSQNMATLLRGLVWIAVLPDLLIQEVAKNVTQYLAGKGLFNPTFDLIAEAKGGREGMEAYIKETIQNYNSTEGGAPPEGTRIDVSSWQDQETGKTEYQETRTPVPGEPFEPHQLPAGLGTLSGPLDQQATWDAINVKITNVVLDALERFDKAAQEQLAALGEVYDSTKTALAELDIVDTTTPGGGSGGPDGGPPPFDFGPPPKFEFEPPPPFTFDPPPKFEFGPPPDMPNIGGGGPDLPGLGDFGDGPNVPGLGGLGGGGGAPGGAFPGGDDAFSAGGFGDLPGLAGSTPGGAGGNPFLGGMPFTGSPFPGTGLPFGNGRTGPNLPNLVDENGNPIGPNNLRPTEFPGFKQGPGNETPSPDGIDFPAGGAGPDIDLPSGGELKLPDGPGGLGGSGAGFPGGGLGDTPGGAPGTGALTTGGAGGEGWADWTGQGGEGQNADRQDGGLGGVHNGLPMMPPPMMPPMMPGDQKDRERQTWLSEDEKVWGIRNTAGSGVIGLPADLAKEVDEQLAPTHVHVRGVAPKVKAGGQRPGKQESTGDDAQQQASG